MRKKYILAGLIILTVAIGCRFSDGGGNQSITVSRTDDYYKFKAQFAERKSERITTYIENTLHTNGQIKDEMDGVVQLNEGQKFHLKAAAGLIQIEFDKRDNSAASWNQLEQLCIGIKKELEQ